MHERALKPLKREWLVRLQGRELFCALCGCLIEARKDLSADHKVAKCTGGPSSKENLLPAHKWCNGAKQAHSYEDWQKNGYKYLKTLVRSWKKNRTKFDNVKVQKCLKALKTKQCGY